LFYQRLKFRQRQLNICVCALLPTVSFHISQRQVLIQARPSFGIHIA